MNGVVVKFFASGSVHTVERTEEAEGVFSVFRLCLLERACIVGNYN